MEIIHKENDRNGVFYIMKEDKQIANVEYGMRGRKTLVINHTRVAKDFEGKGIGKKLVDAAVNFARERKLKVKPLCPFASAVMKRSSSYADVLVSKVV